MKASKDGSFTKKIVKRQCHTVCGRIVEKINLKQLSFNSKDISFTERGGGRKCGLLCLPLVLLRRAPLDHQLAGDLPGGGNGEELGLALEREKNALVFKYLKCSNLENV